MYALLARLTPSVQVFLKKTGTKTIETERERGREREGEREREREREEEELHRPTTIEGSKQ